MAASNPKQDPHPPEGVRHVRDRVGGEGDRRDRHAHRRERVGPGAAADREERVLRDPLAVQGQGLARALRDPHAQAADRHPPADARRRSTRCSGWTTCRRASTSRSGSRTRLNWTDSMAAILAKKLGMTQVFQEDGRVARVTVLEAGPCPVTAIRTHERDGYEAVQLAFGADQGEAPDESRARPSEEGRRATDAPPRRVPRRGRRAPARRDGDRRVLRGRRAREGRGDLEGQGLSGNDQAPQLRQRPEVPRLAQRARARLDRRLGDALARVARASAAPGRWATSAPRRRASRSSRWTRRRTC